MKISKEEIVKIQTAQSFFLQPGNRVHKDKSKYSRKSKHFKKYA
jgi:hypothetical protein